METTGESFAETASVAEIERAPGRASPGDSAAESKVDAPGAPTQPTDGAAEARFESAEGEWQDRAEAAESRVAQLGDRLAAVESAAEDLRRMVDESERARRVDRELLVAGVVDLDGARELVEEQVSAGASVVEAVGRVRERKPSLFAGVRGLGVRATALAAVERAPARSLGQVAAEARVSGDRGTLLRYLRMRRGAD